MSIMMLVSLPSFLQHWGRAFPARRAASCAMRAHDGDQPHLTIEEYAALAGVWRTELALDDGDATISLHLASPKVLHPGSPGGKVHTMLTLPFNIRSASGHQSASWSIHATGPPLQLGEETRDEEQDVLAPAGPPGQLGLSLQLGTLQLEGRGERQARA